MFKASVAVLLAGAALFVAGCQTTAGPVAIVEAQGAINQQLRAGVGGRFVQAEQVSFADADNPAKAEAMLRDGFAFVQGNCSDFFRNAGRAQQWVIVSRDLVGAAATLGTAALALGEADADAVAGFALGTRSAETSLDIYTRNFLFGAENIGAVRSLVSKALSAHRGAVEQLGPFSYSTAMMQLQDHQAICQTRNIAALARDAIRAGDVEAAPTDRNAEGAAVGEPASGAHVPVEVQ